MRLPYAPSTPPSDAPQSSRDIYTAIAARRAPRPLQKLDLALLHSPPIASGWNAFLGAIRSQSVLPQASVQEVAICRIAVLNRAAYEWDAHSILAVRGSDGVGREGMQTILSAEEFVGQGVGERLRSLVSERTVRGGLDSRQWAVLAFADQSTRNVQVDDEVWDVVKDVFSERELVELTATVAAYNCVSRFLAALDVGERNGGEMEVPAEAK
ncbi:hypothetical protein CAC42_7058 [Sphaceloma murrayae]|uniref:Carboxymuconolactone decarboxylase-like domain-containing protein n=1 Tax=Sphaceloma murrayae TaxID=2082308 RepID=A0A2K1QQQ5_9PEZI|nr:hypothetical protein CAC42_7058 [Sphaceloma murrayae]